MKFFKRLVPTRHPESAHPPVRRGVIAAGEGPYGPASGDIERLVAFLSELTADEMKRLAALYATGHGLGEGPPVSETVATQRRKMSTLPLAFASHPHLPAPRAIRTGAEAVLRAISDHPLEAPPAVRQWAPRGGADLAFLLVVRSQADPQHWALEWDWYAGELDRLDSQFEFGPVGKEAASASADLPSKPAMTSEAHHEPCGHRHWLFDANDGERAGSPSMPRHYEVTELVQVEVDPPTTGEDSEPEPQWVDLLPGTTVRYDQLTYSRLSNFGWHRFQILDGPDAGTCVELGETDPFDDEFGWLPDFPGYLEPVVFPR